MPEPLSFRPRNPPQTPSFMIGIVVSFTNNMSQQWDQDRLVMEKPESSTYHTAGSTCGLETTSVSGALGGDPDQPAAGGPPPYSTEANGSGGVSTREWDFELSI